MGELKWDEITCYIVAEDRRYPTLVLQGDFGSVGYKLDKATGELRRVCICSAWSANECCCGAWDDGGCGSD